MIIIIIKSRYYLLPLQYLLYSSHTAVDGKSNVTRDSAFFVIIYFIRTQTNNNEARRPPLFPEHNRFLTFRNLFFNYMLITTERERRRRTHCVNPHTSFYNWFGRNLKPYT